MEVLSSAALLIVVVLFALRERWWRKRWDLAFRKYDDRTRYPAQGEHFAAVAIGNRSATEVTAPVMTFPIVLSRPLAWPTCADRSVAVYHCRLLTAAERRDVENEASAFYKYRAAFVRGLVRVERLTHEDGVRRDWVRPDDLTDAVLDRYFDEATIQEVGMHVYRAPDDSSAPLWETEAETKASVRTFAHVAEASAFVDMKGERVEVRMIGALGQSADAVRESLVEAMQRESIVIDPADVKVEIK